ncbi:transposase [Burkholderia oklahomensis EO147]|nr:transposase [Burkholderia oklahomensis EO147]KUY55847.1 transposase [Burkholderia oklahomensis EO147]
MRRARKLAGAGQQVKLISPQFVRPFVKSNKNGFVDAEAICEAASRPPMRFVNRRPNRNKRCQHCIGFANR